MGVEQPLGERGSLKWTQRLVNGRPDLVADQVQAALQSTAEIEWLSPRQDDAFREYQDQAVLDVLDVETTERPLSEFWPKRGPHWDALARAGSSVVLVEAKAHVAEVFSGGCRAESPDSITMIRQALDETKEALGAKPGLDWMLRFYQYSNRLAHLYFLREVNGIDAHLVFLYFVGDDGMGGPQTRAEWSAAIEVLHAALGIRGRVPAAVHEVFAHVDELRDIPLGGAPGAVPDR